MVACMFFSLSRQSALTAVAVLATFPPRAMVAAASPSLDKDGLSVATGFVSRRASCSRHLVELKFHCQVEWNSAMCTLISSSREGLQKWRTTKNKGVSQ